MATRDGVSPSRGVLTGRGGAGNFGKEHRPSGGAEDLVTPTLKGDTYTTGRGGSGNMAKNHPDQPDVARLAQDVQAPVHREPETFHYGRGGAANIAKPAADEAKDGQESNPRKSNEGLAEKGKDLLDKIVHGKK